jgi:hypothetical protein
MKKNIINKLTRAGQFLRLLDGQNNLSISNLVVILMMGKILVTPALSMADIAAALAALLPYSLKKIQGKDL